MEVESKECLRKLPTLVRRPPVDIEFQDLSYSITRKPILKSMNGKFCSGELTAILGASGSGKTSLLNILAGFVLGGVTGNIKINDKPREIKTFRKISTYIMQEDLLQPHLTVMESMMVVARLKLGDNVNLKEKRLVVEELLNLLGLENCFETRVECISGGERKRLSLALEMVNNPPVIFLDEPTSGLDTMSIKQCINILQILTGQGRTVICTIHQPSVPVFQKFDQVYFIADGMCVYNGSPSNIIPFLTSIGLECPITYSPAEFIIETVETSRESVPILVAAIENGKINERDSNKVRSVLDVYTETTETVDITVDFPTSFLIQFYILFSRMMLQFIRNKAAICIQVFHHATVGILFGIIFCGVGNNAKLAVGNFHLCMTVMLFFVYTYVMTPVLLYPFEVMLLKREYFNRWYGLKPYFLALILRRIPLMFSLGVIFITGIYLITNQPLELRRFLWFTLIGILLAIASESLGLAVGCTFNVMHGSVVGASIIGWCFFLSIYGLGYGNAIEPKMKILMLTSYIRFGLLAMSQAIFGNRKPLDCPDEIYCHYQDPKRLLRDLGMLDGSITLNVTYLICFLLLFQAIAFLSLRCRLHYEFSHKLASYLSKLLPKT